MSEETPSDPPAAVPPIARRALHEELVVRIRELIVSGALAPGSKIPEQELCLRYGVSRTPLREALKLLVPEGLVVLEASRGARVTQITRADLEEVFPVLGALEALAGELACRHLTRGEIGELRRLHDLMLACRAGRDQQGYFTLNEQIHEGILAAARNKTLTAQYRMLALQLRRVRYRADMSEERWAEATAEHEEMIAAIEARDGAALGAVLKRHLAHKMITVCDWLGESSPSA